MIASHRVPPTMLHLPARAQSSFRSFAVVGVLVLTAALVPEARAAQQLPSIQRVQATPPTEGARGWGADNCFYIYQSGGWRSVDMCRVMRGRAVYDTFTPSTGRWGLRFNESEAGWTAILDLNGGNPNAWLKFSNDGRTILAFDGAQWFNFTAAVAAQNQAQSNAQATYAGISTHPALQRPTAADEERERYYEQQRLKKYYENKKIEEQRLAKLYEERAREKARQDRVANDRAAANRDGQRAAADQAAANRAAERAAADRAAANRAAERAAADRAAAIRAAERAAADRAAADRAAAARIR